jgi:hypothetical protein
MDNPVISFEEFTIRERARRAAEEASRPKPPSIKCPRHNEEEDNICCNNDCGTLIFKCGCSYHYPEPEGERVYGVGGFVRNKPNIGSALVKGHNPMCGR